MGLCKTAKVKHIKEKLLLKELTLTDNIKNNHILKTTNTQFSMEMILCGSLL